MWTSNPSSHKDMSGVYDAFFANNLRRIWSIGPSPPLINSGAAGAKSHPRRESKMTHNLMSTFSPANDPSFCGTTISADRSLNYRPKKTHFQWQPKMMNNMFYRTKYLVCVICLIVCLYQLIKFLALYFSYQTSVDAEVVIDTNPQLPGITICYNVFLHDFIMCNRSEKFCKLLDNINGSAIRDDVLQFIHEEEYHINMLRKCAFRYFNNSDDELNGTECSSAWTFNGNEQCTSINAEWVKSLNNRGGYSEFMYGVESYVQQPKNTSITLGADIFIHSPKDIPTRQIRSYFITLSSVYKANFKKTVVYRLEPPFQTDCFNYTRDNRQSGELKIISQQTCYYDCMWKYLVNSCGCIPTPTPFILPYNACNRSTKAACKRDTKSQENICESQCPTACITDYYEYSMTRLISLPNVTYIEVFHELRGNIVVTFTHKPQITSVEIFSNIGGYLGIWLGMSVPLLYDLLVYTMFVLVKRFSTTEVKRQRSINVHLH